MDEREEIIDPLLDTGKWRAEIRRMLAEFLAEQKARDAVSDERMTAIEKAVGETLILTRQEIAELERRSGQTRGIFNAIWHGIGVIKAEVTQIVKDK
jgi:hypothetical protein